LYKNKSREAAQAELDAIYDVQDDQELELALREAIEADEVGIKGGWDEANHIFTMRSERLGG
jgi:hypothetical protein